MKYTYISPRDFEANCPCWSLLTAYAESIIPRGAFLDFKLARRSLSDENTYIAEYDVSSSDFNRYNLEVSCTIQPDRSYSYKTLRKNDIL